MSTNDLDADKARAAFENAVEEIKKFAFEKAVRLVEQEIPVSQRAPDEIFAPVALIFAGALIEALHKRLNIQGEDPDKSGS